MFMRMCIKKCLYENVLEKNVFLRIFIGNGNVFMRMCIRKFVYENVKGGCVYENVPKGMYL